MKNKYKLIERFETQTIWNVLYRKRCRDRSTRSINVHFLSRWIPVNYFLSLNLRRLLSWTPDTIPTRETEEGRERDGRSETQVDLTTLVGKSGSRDGRNTE